MGGSIDAGPNAGIGARVRGSDDTATTEVGASMSLATEKLSRLVWVPKSIDSTPCGGASVSGGWKWPMSRPETGSGWRYSS